MSAAAAQDGLEAGGQRPSGPQPDAPLPKVPLGRTGLLVSTLGLGASALGGEFGAVDEDRSLRTVEAALEAGINLFDTAPAYGAYRSERLLGQALRGVPRERFVLSTKAGKWVDEQGRTRFGFDEDSIRRSVDASAARLGVDVLDIVHLHDFDYQDGAHVEAALGTGFATLRALQAEGRLRFVGAGIYRMELWKRVLEEVPLDVMLLHNHHCLCDLRAHELLPLTEALGVGVINAAPLASGLLSGAPVPAWHPAPPEARRRFLEAAAIAEAGGVPLPRLALAFACSEPRLPVTVFSCDRPEHLADDLRWARDPVDRRLVARVQRHLEPHMNQVWGYGRSA